MRWDQHHPSIVKGGEFALTAHPGIADTQTAGKPSISFLPTVRIPLQVPLVLITARRVLMQDVFVGIDVAIAKRKFLPIVVVTRPNQYLLPVPLRFFNRASKSRSHVVLLSSFVEIVAVWVMLLAGSRLLPRCATRSAFEKGSDARIHAVGGRIRLLTFTRESLPILLPQMAQQGRLSSNRCYCGFHLIGVVRKLRTVEAF